VESAADCDFYHVMELPGVGRVGDQWDLRGTVDAYLGDFDFQGKRALDVGAASGFLTFEMEKRGASVVSFDLGGGRTGTSPRSRWPGSTWHMRGM
jgi:2-polyprenyl-3-methyl-5-hydroxy-6-metoxy-1,4-benzoquinol methylase